MVSKIEYLKETICHCENNLQYIKRLQALKYWLLKLDVLLDNSNDEIYRKYFYSDKVVFTTNYSSIFYKQ